MKIKVIDMLVKMGKDKNYKPTFKYKNTIYQYDFKTKYYTPSFMGLYKIYMILNDEVEIIEELNKIEKIEMYEDEDGRYFLNNRDKKIYIRCDEIDFMIDKFNELIDEINKLKESD